MSYPERLLPQPIYKQIDFNQVNSRSYFLIRHTKTVNITTEEGRLKADSVVFQTDHLRDYSTNILGEFAPQDVGWNWLKETSCTDLWPGDVSVIRPEPGIDVEWVEGRGKFFLAIYQFHQATFPIDEGTGSIMCRVLHTPTNGNFWHCSLRWWWDKEDVSTWGDDKSAQKRRRLVLSSARSYIIVNAILTEPKYQALSPEAYRKMDD